MNWKKFFLMGLAIFVLPALDLVLFSHSAFGQENFGIKQLSADWGGTTRAVADTPEAQMLRTESGEAALAMPVIADFCTTRYQSLPTPPGSISVFSDRVCAGSNGNVTRIAVAFSDTTDWNQIYMIIYLDADRDPGTGRKPSRYFYGPLAADPLMGIDAQVVIYDINSPARVQDAHGELIGSFPLSR